MVSLSASSLIVTVSKAISSSAGSIIVTFNEPLIASFFDDRLPFGSFDLFTVTPPSYVLSVTNNNHINSPELLRNVDVLQEWKLLGPIKVYPQDVYEEN